MYNIDNNSTGDLNIQDHDQNSLEPDADAFSTSIIKDEQVSQIFQKHLLSKVPCPGPSDYNIMSAELFTRRANQKYSFSRVSRNTAFSLFNLIYSLFCMQASRNLLTTSHHSKTVGS